MLTEQQIDYCLARIKEQLTITDATNKRPNVDNVIRVIKQTLAEAYGDTRVDQSDSINELGLREQTVSTLEAAGYLRIRALTQSKTKDILDIRNAGPTMLQEIRTQLSKRGLRLLDDPIIAELRLLVAEKRKRGMAANVDKAGHRI